MKLGKLKKAKNEPTHSKWELTYGTIAVKILRKGKIRKENAINVAKFLGVFVYVFSIPYGFVKMLIIRCKLAKINNKPQ